MLFFSVPCAVLSPLNKWNLHNTSWDDSLIVPTPLSGDRAEGLVGTIQLVHGRAGFQEALERPVTLNLRARPPHPAGNAFCPQHTSPVAESRHIFQNR